MHRPRARLSTSRPQASLLLAVVAAVSLGACGGGGSTTTGDHNNPATITQSTQGIHLKKTGTTPAPTTAYGRRVTAMCESLRTELSALSRLTLALDAPPPVPPEEIKRRMVLGAKEAATRIETTAREASAIHPPPSQSRLLRSFATTSHIAAAELRALVGDSLAAPVESFIRNGVRRLKFSNAVAKVSIACERARSAAVAAKSG